MIYLCVQICKIVQQEEADILFRLRNSITRTASRLHTATRLYLQTELKKANIDITPDMYLILRCLWEKDGRHQQELANLVFKDKASITKLITNLEKRQLVRRQPDLQDRRSNLVLLTARGKKLKEKVYPILMRFMEIIESEANSSEITETQRVLEKLFEKLRR